MKESRSTDSQIMTILKLAAAGTPATKLCRKHGISRYFIFDLFRNNPPKTGSYSSLIQMTTR
jgi:hypothetical protein